MEQDIIDIIDQKASRMYCRMTKTKRVAFRNMLYAGVQVTIGKKELKEVAEQIGYSETGTYKLVNKYIQLVGKGDVTANLIATAVTKLIKKKQRQNSLAPSAKMDTSKSEIKNDVPIVTEMPKIVKRKPKKSVAFGFIFTPEDERRERAAIRSSILFFQKYGQGRPPRMNGEYYTPGTNPDDVKEEESKWLPLDTAALYCGCNEKIISLAGQNGFIERRLYKKNGHNNYYEYKVSDLDKFILENHLT